MLTRLEHVGETHEDYWVRPMRVQDVSDVERLTAASSYDVEVHTHRTQWPEPQPRSPARAAYWRDRVTHLLGTDPAGCVVAEDRTGLIGVAISMRRDLTWILSSYVVRAELRGRGVGRQLLSASLEHGRGTLRGLIGASEDQAALRRYLGSGFAPHPMMFLRGPIPRSVLPVLDRVREGSTGDVDLLDSVDRRVRDAAHGVDHQWMLRHHRLVVVDRTTGSGYAYLGADGGAYLLAATNRRTATELLWEALAATDPDRPTVIGHVTAANPWALDVGLAARMQLHTSGYLAVRGMKPPAPYLPSGAFL